MFDQVDDVKKEPDHNYISKLITQHFSQRLFTEVSDFQMKKSREDEEVLSEIDEDDIYDDMREEYSEDIDDDENPTKDVGRQNREQARIRAREEKERKRKEKERQ
jgi:hypothetical protein